MNNQEFHDQAMIQIAKSLSDLPTDRVIQKAVDIANGLTKARLIGPHAEPNNDER